MTYNNSLVCDASRSRAQRHTAQPLAAKNNMKYSLILMLSLACSAALADQLYYEFLSPGYEDDIYLECDKYVRANHAAFRSDITKLFNANKNKEWKNTASILTKYDTSNLYINNKFTQAVYNCGNGYSFSDGNNYYRSMYADIYMMIKGIKDATEDKTVCKPNIQEHFDNIQRALDTIMDATNKAANKSSNLTGAKNAPSS